MNTVKDEHVAIIGLGYVGLPVALAFGRVLPKVTGFDIDPERVQQLQAGRDGTEEVTQEELATSRVHLTSDATDLGACTVYIVCVPTPVDAEHRPNLALLEDACAIIGPHMSEGNIVVFESTVYPGVTEDICGPALARHSGLGQGTQFKLAYSPERINPGDRQHGLENTIKIVAAQDDETLERIAALYERIIAAGLHRAPSIRVAEAAKVIENTQRDLNIAFMNELAQLFDRTGLPTRDVLAAAGTKWNFARFEPGLVGGHCVGVDPYYLTTFAESVGFQPEIILSGRRVNDKMGRFVVRALTQRLPPAIKKPRVGVLGLTFKENTPDLRNSRVLDIVTELRRLEADIHVHDPRADAQSVEHTYGTQMTAWKDMRDLDGCILAVAHREYREFGAKAVQAMLKPGGVLIDVKSIFTPEDIDPKYNYWSL